MEVPATVKPKKKKHLNKTSKAPTTESVFTLSEESHSEPTSENPLTNNEDKCSNSKEEGYSGNLLGVHTSLYVESCSTGKCYESSTELEEISAPPLESYETASTNFQSEFIRNETLPPNAIEEASRSVGLISLEEDEFSMLTELALKPNEINAFTEQQLLSIYRNEELDLIDSFIGTFVEAELQAGGLQQHPLYALLLTYLRTREKLTASANEIDILIKESKEIQERLWTLETNKITEQGECQDGNPVEGSHEYQVGMFDKKLFSKLSAKLANIRDLVSGQHSLHTYTCQASKLKVENYICQISAKFSSIPHNSPVCLASDMIAQTSDLCSAISVLFHFHRQSISDKEFNEEAKNWLNRLVAILLRVSSWSQHMFILNHVLRSPRNVLQWAVSFVQLPSAPFNCHNPGNYLNHMIATLAAITKPIKERNNFVQEVESKQDEIWVLVDSDGEDLEDSNVPPTSLKENDIISIFNQIPFESLFRQMLQLSKRDETDVYISMTSSQLLRVFAMSRLIMKTLFDGMKTYESKSHSQFCKRLASMLTHTVHYVTDLWEAFRRDNSECHDVCLTDRLQVEYDNIVTCACYYLLLPQRKTILQFLTALPFSSVSLKTIWHLFHIIMQPSKSDSLCKNSNEWWEGVEDLIPSLSEVELYYVLTAASNMALARSTKDWLFIKAVTHHLLQIGFINTSTRESCYKISRTLLSNLTNKHPQLISLILEKLKNCIQQAGNQALYLFREIPLSYWVPNKEDLGLLEHWLLTCPFSSIECSLARYILGNMNWGPNNCSPAELFLKREVHCFAALLVVRIAILYCNETTTSSGNNAITDTIKQMSHITSSAGRLQSEQCLSVWVWEMLFKLRLHLMDQTEPYVWATLSNPMQYFSVLPSLESLPNELSPLVRALKEKQTTAVFTALLMTTTGHSIPLICHSGFSMLLSLVQCHRYFAVLVVLQHIIPLFLECQDALLNHEEFIQVIQGLMVADKTFFKLAKNLISIDFPGMIVKQFGDLIQIHLDTYRKYNLPSPEPLAEIWLKILSKVWSCEPTNSSYLMDVILKTAFFRPEMKAVASEAILKLYEDMSSSVKGKFSLGNWITGYSQFTSLIHKSNPHLPWFALFALEIEEYILHEKQGVWKQLLIDLATSVGKANIDSTLKKSCATLKVAIISSGALPIYRWSQQALDTPVDHPLLPVFWQKFFSLYLQRVPQPSGLGDLGSVGSKFFEGLTNHNYFKKLKKKIIDCKEFYETKCSNTLQVAQERKDWLEGIARLYNTFLFWLEESSLQEPGVYLPSLPPLYKPEKLTAIFHNDQKIWHEYVDYESVRLAQKESFGRWELALSRKFEIPPKPSFTCNELDPILRIIKRLQSYEQPVPPPSLKSFQPVIQYPQVDVYFNRHALFDFLGDSFKSLLDYARSHAIQAGESSSLDCCLLELIPLLYRNVETSVTLHAACDTHTPGQKVPPPNSLNCAGPAVIYLKISEVRLCEATDMAIHNNRMEMTNLIKRFFQPPPTAVSRGSVQIEHSIKFIEDKYKEVSKLGDIQLMHNLEDVGVALFYHLTSLFTDEAIQYSPLKQLITTSVEILGQSFITEDERQCPILLSTLLETPSLSPLLSTHFSPTKSSPQTYVQLYQTLINSITMCNSDQIFVLLTKFDMSQWLDKQKPRPTDCSVLIQLAGKALAAAGQSPDAEFLMIHEVLRRQLCVLMRYDTPAHFIEVVRLCLQYSESHTLSIDTWLDVINTMVTPCCSFRHHLSLTESEQSMAKFAIHQSVLAHSDLTEISNLLSQHFMEERLQYGLYGLYPKYKNYVSPLTSLLGLISHGLVVTTIKKHSPAKKSKVCEEVWSYFTSLYAPWLSPYFTKSLTQPMATWIQQLTEDRSILPPWIASDSGHAHKICAIFTESIRFLMESLPESGILSYVWQYYVATYAHPSVKDHILGVIHSNLLSLPWSKFYPSLTDVDLMLKVSDTYVPTCHTLLGSIFIDINWPSWVAQVPQENLSRIYSSLLHLIIKLSNEPNVRQSGKVLELLNGSLSFQWETVDFASYESAVNWFVMSYDPRVILHRSDETCDIDKSVLLLLKYAGGFVPLFDSLTIPVPRKRQVFVRACVKLLISCYNRYKQALRTELDSLSTTIEILLTEINTIIPSSPLAAGEGSLYVGELLALLNGPLVKTTHSSMLSWLSKRGACIVTKSLLKTLPIGIHDPVILGSLLEASLISMFHDSDDSDWGVVFGHLQDFVPSSSPLTEVFSNEGHLLSLYSYLSKRIPVLTDLDAEAGIFKNLVSSLASMKCWPEKEAKMIPLFHMGLVLGGRQADHNPQLAFSLLKKMVEVSDTWADFKPPWGILGSLGIRKQIPVANRCRVMCRTFSALVLCQFPDRKGELLVDQPPFIRTTPHAPGGITSNNMELGPGSATLQAMSLLECLSGDKNYVSEQPTIGRALALIRAPDNSLHNASNVFLTIAKLFYSERFITTIPDFQSDV